MARPAQAREAVIAAAEAIVKRSGAANLTFDELVRVSGITRGGITYHFPTKEALLEALVEHDIARWRACIAEKRASLEGANVDLVAYIAAGTERDAEAARLVAGLLSAVSVAPHLNERWREYFAEHLGLMAATPDPDLAVILSLAAEGLFWVETLDLIGFDGARRAQVVDRMLALAGTVGRDASMATGGCSG